MAYLSVVQTPWGLHCVPILLRVGKKEYILIVETWFYYFEVLNWILEKTVNNVSCVLTKSEKILQVLSFLNMVCLRYNRFVLKLKCLVSCMFLTFFPNYSLIDYFLTIFLLCSDVLNKLGNYIIWTWVVFIIQFKNIWPLSVWFKSTLRMHKLYVETYSSQDFFKFWSVLLENLRRNFFSSNCIMLEIPCCTNKFFSQHMIVILIWHYS